MRSGTVNSTLPSGAVPNGGQLIQGVEAMADVTSSDRCSVATSDTAQFPLTGVALSAARETVP
jgi:hypothetical protein